MRVLCILMMLSSLLNSEFVWGQGIGNSSQTPSGNPVYWKLGGNTANPNVGVNPVLGTTNKESITIVTDGIERVKITETGEFKVGTSVNPVKSQFIGSVIFFDTIGNQWSMQVQGNILGVYPKSFCAGRICSHLALVPEDNITGNNVGIGTTNPQKKLHVFTDHSKCGCRTFPTASHEGIRIENVDVNGNRSVWDIEPEYNYVYEEPYLRIGIPGEQGMFLRRWSGGTVGVGINIMPHRIRYFVDTSFSVVPGLVVNRWAAFGEFADTNRERGILIGFDSGNAYIEYLDEDFAVGRGKLLINRYSRIGVEMFGDLRVNNDLMVWSNYRQQEVFKVNVINGITYARKIKVTLSNFLDYVFDSTYVLLPLSKKAEYWSKYKRLPGFPSAEEIEDEGADLGELIRLLVQEVEELNIRLYELEQENKVLKDSLKLILQRRVTK